MYATHILYLICCTSIHLTGGGVSGPGGRLPSVNFFKNDIPSPSLKVTLPLSHTAHPPLTHSFSRHMLQVRVGGGFVTIDEFFVKYIRPAQ